VGAGERGKRGAFGWTPRPIQTRGKQKAPEGLNGEDKGVHF